MTQAPINEENNINTPSRYHIPNGRPIPYVKNPSFAIFTLFAALFLMIGLLSVVLALIAKGQELSATMMRITTVLQDILVFIVPALLAAMLATRLPATLLRLDVKPKLKPTLMAIAVLIMSLPALNFIVYLNENIQLPEGIESAFKSMEDSAGNAIGTVIGGDSIPDLIVSVLIIGLLTGLAEELFFRGAFQGLLFTTKIKRHLAVWIAAAVFSLLHFQFYGFVPRMLLGAYFGYLLWWTGSIWVPVILHALNNTIALIGSWLALRSGEVESVEAALNNDMTSNATTIALSAIVTVLGIIILRRICLRK